ncbi:MAG: MerR family transcriptional regulator [Parasulfuritortus sp.]|jgi:DNA-binding transcriptional MerR regulator/methylmalonyl-CoA mutase cobalamin-binding subunit|nr:MerR family transcriptional regulator [Parasulfuritortus sp.]
MDFYETALSIGTVERETGLSKDVLRKWEIRYGFPNPDRDTKGERVYPAEQVARLRQIKHLMGLGHRPSKLMNLSQSELSDLAAHKTIPAGGSVTGAFVEEILTLLRAHDPASLKGRLGRLLQEQGLRLFVQDTAEPVSIVVGEAWARGELQVFEEHLYSEVMHNLLRGTLEPLNSPSGKPRVLMTTVPEEGHSLGLLMAASSLVLGGAHCIYLGPQMPIDDIGNAARAHNANVVALSFSTAYPRRRVLPVLLELRQRLSPAVEIWAGGMGVRHLAEPGDGIHILATPDQLESVMSQWIENKS